MTRLRKVKLNPTAEQKRTLGHCQDLARFSYNEAVARIRAGARVNRLELRNAIVTEKGNPWMAERPWLSGAPKVMRQQAVFQAVAAHKAAFANLAAGNQRHFEVRMRSKRARSWTLGIERNAKALPDGAVSILPTVLGSRMRHYGELPPLDHDLQIHKDGAGRYFLLVPISVPVRPFQAERPTVAMDPGVRKFLATFDDAGVVQFIGCNYRDRIWSILESIDSVDAQLRTPQVGHVKKLRRLKMRLYRQYRDLQDEMHWKVADALTREYSTIILP